MKARKNHSGRFLALALAFVMVVSLATGTSITSQAADVPDSHSAEAEDTDTAKNNDTKAENIDVPDEKKTEENEDSIVGSDENTEEKEADVVDSNSTEENADDITDNGSVEDNIKAMENNGTMEESADSIVDSVPEAMSEEEQGEEVQEEPLSGTCGTEGENLTWRLEKNSNSDTYSLIIEGSGDMVDSPPAEWQSHNDKITEISLPEGLTSIGTGTFFSFTQISYIEIPDTVKSIGRNAFAKSSLKEIVIPKGIVSLGAGMFSNCKQLTKAKIGDGCTSIGQTAFNNCTGLKEIEIPASVTSVEKRAFNSCTALEKVYYQGTEEQWATLKANAATGNDALINCTNVICGGEGMPETMYSITVLDGIKGTVTVDKTSAARGETVTVDQTPDDGYNFIRWAIRDDQNSIEVCNVKNNKFTMPAQDVVIVALYESNKWGEDITWKLSENEDGDTYTLIIEGSGDMATAGGYAIDVPWNDLRDKITSVSLPEGLTRIGSYAFANTKITEINIPDSVTVIEKNAFFNCNYLRDVNFPDGLTGIGSLAFAYTALSELKLPAGVMTSLTDWSFYQCLLLNKVEIEEGATSISLFIFDKCENLKEIVIPASVTSIDRAAFRDCNSLDTVYFRGTKEQWETLLNENTNTWEDANAALFNVKNVIFGYGVTVESDGNGTASASVERAAEGETVELTATPNKGYQLKEWQVVSGDAKVANNSFKMPAGDVTVKAVFTKVVPAKVSSIKISGISKKLAAGKKVTLKAEVSPANADNKAVTWKSSNKKYATVNASGKVTLKKAGAGKTVTITATSKDGSAKKASYKVKIMKHAVKSVKLKAAKTVKAGKKTKVKATIKTTGKKVNKTLKWTSSNTKYATVSSKGVVKATKAGKGKTVKITATSTDGSNKKKTVKIKIK